MYVPKAASDQLGVIKTGYTTSGQNYKVEVDINGNAYVNVPWTDNNTDTKNTAGTTEKETDMAVISAENTEPYTVSATKKA